MKRDMDLVREILLRTEELTPGKPWGNNSFESEAYSAQEVNYHAILLIKAEFVEGKLFQPGDYSVPLWNIQDLTWKGHEFLDATRDDTIWKKVKSEIAAKGSSFTLGLIINLANKLLREQFNLE